MWHNIPQLINPIAFSFGPLEVRWYALMWLFAFGSIYLLLRLRVSRGEADYSHAFLTDLAFNALFGALIGGRLGYVIFYNFSYYLSQPLMIVSPYDFASDTWVGIAGMSYHGGVIGVLCAFWWTARVYKKNILAISDFVVPAIGLGYFFGRMGNFLNAELVGRETTVPWAMVFGDEIMRHPSQLYEALGEGIIIFMILWFLRKKGFATGTLTALYIIFYGSIRFVLEFFRAPDAHIGLFFGGITLGQIFSMVMVACGLCGLLWIRQSSSIHSPAK